MRRLLALFALVIALAFAGCLPSGTPHGLWRAPIDDMPFSADFLSGGISSGGLFVMGNRSANQDLEMNLARLDLTTLQWEPRAGFAGTDGGFVFGGGGAIVDGVPYACVYGTLLSHVTCGRYENGTDSWTALPDPPSGSFNLFRMAAAGGKFYLHTPAALVSFDPLLNAWASFPSSNNPFQGGAFVEHEGKLYRFGASPPAPEMFDPATGSWTALPSPGSGVTIDDGGISLGGKIWLLRDGGTTGTTTIITFDPAAGTYSDAVALRTPRVNASLVGSDDTLFVLGGRDPANNQIGSFLKTAEGFTP